MNTKLTVVYDADTIQDVKALLDAHPWSAMSHSHAIHSCDACAAQGAAQVQAMLAAVPRNATLYDPDEVAFPIQRSADGTDALPPELASTARPASTAAEEVAAPIAARLRLEGTQ